MMLFSVDRVLEKAGNYNGLKQLLEASNQPVPTYNAVCLWRFRGLIPGWWIGCITYAMAANGVHPLELLIDTSPDTSPVSADTEDSPV